MGNKNENAPRHCPLPSIKYPVAHAAQAVPLLAVDHPALQAHVEEAPLDKVVVARDATALVVEVMTAAAALATINVDDFVVAHTPLTQLQPV